MAVQKKKFVGTTSVGDAPKLVLERTESIRAVFHNFKDMEEKRNEVVYTAPLEAFKYLWRLLLLPRGRIDSSNETEYISCSLEYVGDAKYKPAAKFSFRCKDYVWKSTKKSYVFDSLGLSGVWGCSDFLKREEVLEEYLEEDGSLIIEVDLQITADSKRVWYPKKFRQEDSLVQSYSDSSNTTSDAVFVVEGMEYHAHKMILSLRAKTLYELSKEQYVTSDDDDQPRVPLPNMKGETFKILLEYIYTVNTTPKIDNEASAIELLLAADRFECTQLKLYVESTIVDKFLTTDNAASMLVLGDSHSLALLKEAAINMYASDPVTVQESEGWSRVEESHRLVTKLLKSVSLKLALSKNRETAIQGDVAAIEHSNITSLREQLQEVKLDLDGSRETLVDRLLKSWWESRPKIVVSNAGYEEVNGSYTRDFYNSSDGSHKYSMIGVHEGNNCMYSISRCETIDGEQYWYLSIAPKGKTPGTDDDIDFYSLAPIGDCQDSPPLSGWKAMIDANPPPNLSFSD
jgi:hypothetical protein